jgi:hypothetical protein
MSDHYEENDMDKNAANIKRSELYEKVWTTPMLQLAKEFGISDVALAKTCKRYNIPKPGLGYWSKLKYGKNTTKMLLPKSEDGDCEIMITASEKPEIRTQDSDPEQVALAEELIRKINMDGNPITSSNTLDNAHKYVIIALSSLTNAKANECGILVPKNKKCLPLHVSAGSLNRSLLIMDSLLSFLERYDISIDSESLDKINLLGQKISFSLTESLNSKEVELTSKQKAEKELYSWKYRHPTYIYTPSGNLSLSIDEKCYPSGLRRTWHDNSNQKLNKYLKKFIISAIEIAVYQETAKRKHKRWELKIQQEQKREAEIRQKRWDEQKRVEQLEKEISQWLKSQQIRSYVSFVHSEAITQYGSIEKDSPLGKWILWATRRADIIDPLVNIQPEDWEINFDERNHYW